MTNSSLKIGIDASFLAKKYSGTHDFVFNLINGLLKDKQNIVLFIPIILKDKTKESIQRLNNFNGQIIYIDSRFCFSSAISEFYYNYFQLVSAAEKNNITHLFSPSPWAYFGNTKIKTYSTVHDVIPWKFAEYTNSLSQKLKYYLIKKLLYKHEKIFTVSEFSKREIVKYLEYLEENIYVLPNTLIHLKNNPFSYDLLANKYKLKKPYILYAGGYDKRKNIPFMRDVFKSLSKEYQLIAIGDKLYDTKLYKDYDLLKNNQHIILTGFIDEYELDLLFKNATILFSFSKYEGFNIPVLRALMNNTLCFISDIPIHKELYLDSAILCPLDKEKTIKIIKSEIKQKKRRQNKQKVVSSSSVAHKFIICLSS